MAVCLACYPTLHAQGKGKPKPARQGVTAVFASNVTANDVAAVQCSSLPPGISGDGAAYGFDPLTQTGAYLRSDLDNDFVLDLQDGGRGVYLNFSQSVGAGPATPTLPAGFCHVMLDEFTLDTHTLNPNGVDDPSLGLTDIPPGSTNPARVKAFFDYVDVYGNVRTYTIRFNPVTYPGSTNVAITRGPITDPSDRNYGLMANQWVIETGPYAPDAGDVAQLVSPALTKRGNPGPNSEGFYRLPFKITVTLP